MAKAVRLVAIIGTFLALILSIEPPVYGQTSVVVEVKVLQLAPIELDKLGAFPMRPGFTRSVSTELIGTLTNTSRSKVVHRLELQGMSGKSSELRVDSRIPGPSSSSKEATSYYEVGIGVDVVPKVFQNRDIALATASRVRIRRGTNANTVPPTLFETSSIKHETRIHDGETIVLAGFITDAERTSLPNLSAIPDNPILNYLFPKNREQRNSSEIVVLLTPRIVGMVIDPIIDTPVNSPVVLNAPVVKPTVVDAPVIKPLVTDIPATNVDLAFVVDKPVVVTAPSNAVPPAAVIVPSPIPVPVSAPVSAPPPAPAPTTASAPNPAPVSPPPSVPAPTAISSSIPSAAISAKAPISSPLAPATTAASPSNVAKPPVSSASREVRGMYTVQVGAFDNVVKAEALVAQLSKTHDAVFIDKVAGRTPFRVRVGRFPDMQSARQLQRQLGREGFETFLTTLD